jgi:hypothetical protein
MKPLDKLEAHLQTLLEIQLLKFLPGYKVEDGIFQQLAAAMNNNIKDLDGRTFAPNVFVITARPSKLVRWSTAPDLLKDFAKAIRFAGEEVGFSFLSNPSVSIAEDLNISGDKTLVLASFSREKTAETRGITIDLDIISSHSGNIPANAFLVMDGHKTIPLDVPVVNIGRRLNNQVIINDKRVSRTHAQLRAAKGRFTLFDLNSSGGTFVNGRRIVQSILYPGDVISLAGVTLIYGMDLPGGESTQKVIRTQKSTSSSLISTDDIPAARNITNRKSKL